MEEIAREYGMCLLYMVSVMLIIVLYLSFVGTDGILSNLFHAYMNGLTGR